jgi:hypothetical protein
MHVSRSVVVIGLKLNLLHCHFGGYNIKLYTYYDGIVAQFNC